MQQNEIVFLWVPDHAGIPGNNETNRLAKSGLQMENITNIPLTPEEAIRPVKAAIHKKIRDCGIRKLKDAICTASNPKFENGAALSIHHENVK